MFNWMAVSIYSAVWVKQETFQYDVTLLVILYLVEYPSVIKIKVHNVFYTHTFIYSELILMMMVSNIFYNFLDFLTQ